MRIKYITPSQSVKVQWVTATVTASYSSYTVTLPKPVSVGDLIVTVQITDGNDNLGATFTPTDNFNNTYNSVGGAYLGQSIVCGGSVSSIGEYGVYYAISQASGQLSVTVSWEYPISPFIVAVIVFSGLKYTGTPQAEGVSGQSTNSSPITFTTTLMQSAIYKYVIALVYYDYTSINLTPTISPVNSQQLVEYGETGFTACYPSTVLDLAFGIYIVQSKQNLTLEYDVNIENGATYGIEAIEV